MKFTTTNIIEGSPVKEYKGIVSGEVVAGAHVGRDILASLRDFFGGRSKSYEKVLISAKKEALDEMAARAEELGANAVIGIDFDYEVLGKSMLMVAVSGTAVII
jgi:uncharacterized protein YbjQ (UPF0145 family)